MYSGLIVQYHLQPSTYQTEDPLYNIIGNTPRDVAIPQSGSKMKACLGQNAKISSSKANQIKEKSKTAIVKGVPTEFTADEFKEILDSNKIHHAKAERMKSRRDGRSFEMFQNRIKVPS